MMFPKDVYSDDGPEFKGAFEEVLNMSDITHTITRTHAAFAERFIRTLKMMLNARLRHFKGLLWDDALAHVMQLYNNGKGRGPGPVDTHTSTGMTPAEGTKDENSLQVKLSLMLHAKHNRKYPPLHVGDWVRIRVKPDKMHKEDANHWSDKQYLIANKEYFSGQLVYALDPGGKMFYLRHELLLAE